MLFDPLVINPGRLRILTALAHSEAQEFVRLRSATRLTDGNLATHAKRLESAGLLAVEKTFREGKPVTTYALTSRGRDMLRKHVDELVLAMTAPAAAVEIIAVAPLSPDDSVAGWNAPVEAASRVGEPEEDWID